MCATWGEKPASAVDDYYTACSVQEALAYLVAHRGEARLIAGGTSLLPQPRQAQGFPARLVDVSQVATMKRIVRENGMLSIGGAVTFEDLATHSLVRSSVPLLYEAARQISVPEVRRVATLVGNVIAAEGNAHGAVALVALEAEARIVNLTGAQWLPVESLFVRPGVSWVDSSAEIVTAVQCRVLNAGQGVALAQIAPLEQNERSPLVLALVVTLDLARQAIAWASVAWGSNRSVPHHQQEAEDALRGLALEDGRAREAFAAVLSDQAVRQSLLEGVSPKALRQAITTLATSAYERAVEMALTWTPDQAQAPSGALKTGSGSNGHSSNNGSNGAH